MMEVFIPLLALFSAICLTVSDDTDCSLLDNEDLKYSNNLSNLSDGPSNLIGFYTYFLPEHCGGIVSSVRARGFCPITSNDDTVVLQVVNSTFINDNLSSYYTNITVDCNTSYEVVPGYYEGYAIADNLTITIRGDVQSQLSVKFGSKCSRGHCFFQPAIVNTTSNHSLVYFSDDLYRSKTFVDRSLLFQAIIEPGYVEENGNEKGKIITVSVVPTALFLLVCLAAIAITSIVLVKKKRSEPSLLSSFSNVQPSIHPEYLSRSAAIQTTVCNVYNDSRNEQHLPSQDDNPYDYVRDEAMVKVQSKVPSIEDEGHYEYDLSQNEDPYWEPASVEDELKQQLQKLTITSENLTLTEELGSGEFGVVKRGVWSVEGEEREVAVKLLADESTEEQRIQFLQEAAIMSQFKHPNVITFYGVLFDTTPVMFVVEIMKIGDLRDYLATLKLNQKSQHVFENTPGLLLSFCRQIASGMTYLSGKGFIHRDLAARNILLSYNEMCKIADFGMSRALQDTHYYVSRGGKIPVKWTAPEALSYKKYSTASDVWSFGALLYEIWALGVKPFSWMTNTEAYQNVQAGYRLPPPPGCPRAIYKTMISCWNPEPELRPTFPDIQTILQRPDFKLLTWTTDDVACFSEEARTLGAPLEAGKELYCDAQKTYLQ